MRLGTMVKVIAGLIVLGIIIFTSMLGYHAAVTPLGGVFEKIISRKIVPKKNEKPEEEIVKMLDSNTLPDIDPGEQSFQRAHELLALGQMPEAREKLKNVVEVFPSSPSATSARHILGEMNLDEILSNSNLDGKLTHIVKRGNSFLGIAAEHKTTLDMIMHLNGMLELKGLQPGEEFIVMPLEFRVVIETQRKVISIWKAAQFVKEFPIQHYGVTGKLPTSKTTISGKSADYAGKKVSPQAKEYRMADKIIQIAKPTLQIRSNSDSKDDSKAGIILSPQDMEEVSLLTRAGNEVEIR